MINTGDFMTTIIETMILQQVSGFRRREFFISGFKPGILQKHNNNNGR